MIPTKSEKSCFVHHASLLAVRSPNTPYGFCKKGAFILNDAQQTDFEIKFKGISWQ